MGLEEDFEINLQKYISKAVKEFEGIDYAHTTQQVLNFILTTKPLILTMNQLIPEKKKELAYLMTRLFKKQSYDGLSNKLLDKITKVEQIVIKNFGMNKQELINEVYQSTEYTQAISIALDYIKKNRMLSG